MSTVYGKRVWIFPGGNIPPDSTGDEPEFTSRDELCVLNMNDADVELEMTVFHSDGDPVGPYPLKVAARRVRHVRINDLIDPQAIYLGEPYGLVVTASASIVAQVTRVDTRRGGVSTAMAPGFATD